MRIFRIFVADINGDDEEDILVSVLALVFAAPATATAMTEVAITGTVTGQHGPPDMEAPGCPPGTAWRFPSSGSGELSPFGMVDYVLTQCTTFGAEPGSFLSVGTITFTFAAGDTLVIAQEMRSQLVGAPDAPPDGFTLEATWTVVDGTGRFAGAMGSGKMDGVGHIPGGVNSFGIPDGLAQFNFTGMLTVHPMVTGMVLVDASTDQDVAPLKDGAVIDLRTTPHFNIRVETVPGTVGSVGFTIVDADGKPVHFRMDGTPRENFAPYAVGGDWPVGNYLAMLLGPGTYTLTATPYSGGNLTGTAGKAMTVTFTVVETQQFTAELMGEVTFELGTPTHLERCGPEPMGPFVTTIASGEATGLGTVSSMWTHCVVGAIGFVDGQGTITTADGNTVSFAYDNPEGAFTFTATVVAGTGRFAGATGSAEITFSVVPQLLPGCEPSAENPCYNPTVPWPWAGTIVVTIT